MCEYKGVLQNVLPKIQQVHFFKISCYLWK